MTSIPTRQMQTNIMQNQQLVKINVEEATIMKPEQYHSEGTP